MPNATIPRLATSCSSSLARCKRPSLTPSGGSSKPATSRPVRLAVSANGRPALASAGDVVRQRGPLGFELVDTVLHDVADAYDPTQDAVHDHWYVADSLLGHHAHYLFQRRCWGDRVHLGRVDGRDRLRQDGGASLR